MHSICTNIFLHAFTIIFLDQPNYDIPDNYVTKSIQRKWLMEICTKYVEQYVMPINVEVDALVQNFEKYQDQQKEMEESRATGFICRVDGCEKKYVNHSNRVK